MKKALVSVALAANLTDAKLSLVDDLLGEATRLEAYTNYRKIIQKYAAGKKLDLMEMCAAAAYQYDHALLWSELSLPKEVQGYSDENKCKYYEAIVTTRTYLGARHLSRSNKISEWHDLRHEVLVDLLKEPRMGYGGAR